MSQLDGHRRAQYLKKVMARASGGCARAIGNPASGGAPGQAALYIGALHLTL